ncbi:glycoside hydrolase family 16 protein [Flammula alnicola]|nr:glycoside hydrolase family 16 protein [Flammula alnicola]
MKVSRSALFPLLVLPTSSVAFGGKTYFRSSDIVGPAFYNHFNWEAIDDPTHGRVNYVDEYTSIRQNLTYVSPDTFILRADHKTVLDMSGPGRNSVRIISKKTYTTHIAVFDVRHMPQGCGTWPAIWETQATNWPDGGEIDIVEAFVMERTEQHISVWFWARHDARVPEEVKEGLFSMNTKTWGVPAAYFPNTNCDLTEYFGEHNIIINLTLCGDWAGNVYSQSGCPSTCVDFVNNNPASFAGAYFDIAAIRVYEPRA